MNDEGNTMKKRYLKILLMVVAAFISLSVDLLMSHADSTRNVTIKSLNVKVYDTDASTAVSMPNSEYSISYVDSEGLQQSLTSGETDSEGLITNVELKEVPTTASKLEITYTMGNETRGYIKNLSTDKPYTITFGKSIPEGNVISYKTSARFATSGEANSYTLHYLVARMNYYYNEVVNQTTHDIQVAHATDSSISEFRNQPINLYYERGSFVDVDNGFYRNGHDRSGVADIVLSDHASLSTFTDYYIKHAIAHEWTHWNLVRTANLPSGSYKNHYSYNEQTTTSYKEGGPAFVADMLTHEYSLADVDSEAQNDNYNGVNRLYGKSTIRTVEQVLYDLLDVSSNNENEDYFVSESLLNTADYTNEQISEINFGVLYAQMMQSKAKNLSEFLQYIQEKYVTSDTDKSNFQQVLTLNGLSSTGDFTLDADGNLLTE